MRKKRLWKVVAAVGIAGLCISNSAVADGRDIQRIYGHSRYETSTSLSQRAYEKSDTVLLTSGQNFPDGLTGGVLAKNLNAPVLTTESGTLTASTKEEIQRLGAKKVVILGGNLAVSPKAEKELEGMTTERISGTTRYDTAVEIAKKIGLNGRNIFIVTGENYPDSLVLSAVSKSPIILVKRDSVPDSVRRYLEENASEIETVNFVGGSLAIKDEVREDIRKILPKASFKNIQDKNGGGRYETAYEIAKTITPTGKLLLATGENFADSASASALANIKKAPLLITQKSSLNEYVKKYIAEYDVQEITIIGGPNAISDKVERELREVADIVFLGRYTSGQSGDNVGAAEIVSYNPDNGRLYVINGKDQVLDIVEIKLGEDNASFHKVRSVDLSNIKEGFVLGDITSVDVNSEKDYVVVALQEKNYASKGMVAILDYEGKVLKTVEVGIQPDMVVATDDGEYILTADEGEPREGYGDGKIDPKGSVTVVEVKNISDAQSTIIDFSKFDGQREKLVADKVILKKNALPSRDLEPEYVAVDSKNQRAYVTLQENNAIATINLVTREIEMIKGLGFKDHSLKGNELDLIPDEKIEIKNQNVKGVYMPDTIDYIEIDGIGYLGTANEGDAREWGDYENTTKSVIDGKKVEHLISDMHEGLQEDEIYILGGRSFSIWKADTLEQVYDSGSDFERVTARVYPDYFNVSNDELEMDSRSGKKGPEPEAIKFIREGEKVYGIVALERIGGVLRYDVTDPENSKYMDYINTRDFKDDIAGDSGPEGIDAVAPSLNSTGKSVLFVSNEISGTVAVYKLK